MKRQQLPAFSLIEVALSLIILGLVTSFIIPLFTSYLTLDAQRRTDQHQQQILASLANYVLRHSRLPCPAHITSTKGEALSQCRHGIGRVPYQTLGLSEKIAKDGHNHWFIYIVNPELTSETIQSLDQSDAKCFCRANNRILTIDQINLPTEDCLAVVLSSAPVPPDSLQLKNSLHNPLIWISRDNLMALYAKRPCQPLQNQARSSTSPRLPISIFKGN
jgi:type II secretory pathway pseudopilin PulG